MRPTRTPSEQHAVDAIITALKNEGCDVSEVPHITDRPDAALIVDGRTIALECRTFTSERLLRLHGINKPDGKLTQVFIPLEPHIWLSKAILHKEAKIQEYRERTGAEQVWLVLHSARGIFSQLSGLYNEGLADLFHMAAIQTQHTFTRIYLTGEFDLPPVCIFSELQSSEMQEDFYRKTVKRIPVRLYPFAKVMATEGPNGEGQIAIDLFQPGQEQILLQPLDKRFRVDYSPVTSLPSEDVMKISALSLLYAEPVAPE